MGLFGSGARKSNGIVATPEQEEESRRAAMRLGIPYEFDGGGQQAPQERPQSFWQGGGKFGVRDGIAGALAALGDAFSHQAGQRGGAVNMLAGGRMDAMERARKAQEDQQRLQEMIAVGGQNGLTSQQVMAQHMGLKLPEAEKPPAIAQNLDYFINNIMPDPKRLEAFGEYQDYVNPRYAQGADGRQYQQQRGLPTIGSVVPDPRKQGGPAPAPGNFRPY